jgi:hypothetical protein
MEAGAECSDNGKGKMPRWKAAALHLNLDSRSIEAMDTLRDMAAKGQVASDDRTLAVLRDRMAKDPDTYIRAQSAAAIRELGPHQKF